MTELFGTVGRELLASVQDALALLTGEGRAWRDPSVWAVRGIVIGTIVVLAWAAFRFGRGLIDVVVRRTRVPPAARAPLVLGLRLVVTVLAFAAVLGQLGVDRATTDAVVVASVIAYLFYLGWWTGNRFLAASAERSGLDPSLQQLLRNVLAVGVAAVAFVMIMDQFGVNVLAAVTALGVVGIAVGFAAQETLSNFIAGITLLIERPFRIGDWVEVDGKVGRVDGIRLRTTLIVDRDNVHTILPNAQVAAGRIVNLSGGGPLRIRVPLGIAYKERAAEARAVILPVLRAHPDVLRGEGFEPGVAVAGLGDSSIDLVALAWISADTIAVHPRVVAQLTEGIKDALDEAGIEIPFPHLQLFVDGAKGLEPLLDRTT